MDRRILCFVGVVVLCTFVAVGALGRRPTMPEVFVPHLAVRLHPGAHPDEVARLHGYINGGHVVDNIYIFHEDYLDGKPSLESHSGVHWAKKQVAKKRYKRDLATDPMYKGQWNLKILNVEWAWNRNYKGKNVTIAIVDDGLDRTHPEFYSKYSASSSWDFNYNDPDPSPFSYDPHGTEAAGAAAARANNSVCGAGVAPAAMVSGIRLIADYTTDVMEARALTYAKETNDIFSCSWGPADDGQNMEGPESITLAALADAVRTGRNGRGTIYVWAAGNGLEKRDSCAFDGYASNKYAITIGAVDSNLAEGYYSEKCATVMGVTPSSGHTGKAVVASGLNGACVSTFGGTSAACPQAAGLIALMLSARPELTWRDVQAVIAKSGVRVASSDPEWVVNQGGYNHSPKYGFGLLTANALITNALTHQLLPPYVNFTTVSVNSTTTIGTSSGAMYTLSVDPSASSLKSSIGSSKHFVLEHLEIDIDLACRYRGQVTMTLTSPHGTETTLQEAHGDIHSNIRWTYTSKRTFGENPAGTWSLLILPGPGGISNQVRLNSWKMTLYGHIENN